MDKQRRLIITFAGTKKQLYRQLKVWCAENDKSMNQTIMGFIEKGIKKLK